MRFVFLNIIRCQMENGLEGDGKAIRKSFMKMLGMRV